MRKITLYRYCDPGHSWFKVKRSVLTAIGIEHKITPYSYQRGDYCYLEEDCDADTLFKALKELSIQVKQVCHWTNRQSKIRNYYCFRPNKPIAVASDRGTTMYHEEL